MTVLELLEELEEIVNTASAVPLTGKIMVEKNEILELVNDIRQSLPDDVKQAKWLKDEQDRILDDAKSEYKKLIVEAKKQADFMVDSNDITLKAKKRAEAINKAADVYARDVKMRTFDYLDKMIYDVQEKMQNLNSQYMDAMYNQISNTFSGVEAELDKNREELKKMAVHTKDGEEWMYEQPSENGGQDPDGGDR